MKGKERKSEIPLLDAPFFVSFFLFLQTLFLVRVTLVLGVEEHRYAYIKDEGEEEN